MMMCWLSFGNGCRRQEWLTWGPRGHPAVDGGPAEAVRLVVVVVVVVGVTEAERAGDDDTIGGQDDEDASVWNTGRVMGGQE